MDDVTPRNGHAAGRQHSSSLDSLSTPSERVHTRSSSGGLGQIPYLRPPEHGDDAAGADTETDIEPFPAADDDAGFSPTSPTTSPVPSRVNAVITQQKKSRRRKGSLRKVALLGRGVQQRLEVQTSPFALSDGHDPSPTEQTPKASGNSYYHSENRHERLFVDTELTPRPSMDTRTEILPFSRPAGGYADSTASMSPPGAAPNTTSPTLTYTSTTDEDDLLSMPSSHLNSALRPDLSLSSVSESYYASQGKSSSGSGGGGNSGSTSTSLRRRRSNQAAAAAATIATSPLSLGGGLATAAAVGAAAEEAWDYSETEWWGWVILVMTWLVFVMGMGSCLGVWTWAWDVGETPYAPPELEDDPTLPIVGYYPALIILTAVMAWVWVVVAWVGMKYFRHAKISGD